MIHVKIPLSGNMTVRLRMHCYRRHLCKGSMIDEDSISRICPLLKPTEARKNMKQKSSERKRPEKKERKISRNGQLQKQTTDCDRAGFELHCGPKHALPHVLEKVRNLTM